MITESAIEELAKSIADNVTKNISIGPISHNGKELVVDLAMNKDYMAGVNDTLSAVLRFLEQEKDEPQL